MRRVDSAMCTWLLRDCAYRMGTCGVSNGHLNQSAGCRNNDLHKRKKVIDKIVARHVVNIDGDL